MILETRDSSSQQPSSKISVELTLSFYVDGKTPSSIPDARL